MTPEQQDLLRRKCTKRDLYQSHLMRLAIGSAFDGKFTPLDIIDGPIQSNEKSEQGKPSERRRQKWGHWNWSEKQIFDFCLERNYAVEMFFEPHEIELLTKGET